ncbi:Hypothetical_protein [Hexamita inflata]|uniref:Hypothetical_protein n=1 Tax=Hexamita inflata TaxID=28002 RepID=A0AA86PWZ5_9EUKA|nr:Hypothetical protein HINF_LOCUS33342 [Hexamita inflata]
MSYCYTSESDCNYYCAKSFTAYSCSGNHCCSDASDVVGDILQTWVIILIVVAVLIVLGVIGCIVGCVCGCCRGAQPKTTTYVIQGQNQMQPNTVVMSGYQGPVQVYQQQQIPQMVQQQMQQMPQRVPQQMAPQMMQQMYQPQMNQQFQMQPNYQQQPQIVPAVFK